MVDDLGTISGYKGVVLYLDEIQYLNKKQQQSLLEYIEDGRITLIASTTENPYFYIYGRCSPAAPSSSSRRSGRPRWKRRSTGGLRRWKKNWASRLRFPLKWKRILPGPAAVMCEGTQFGRDAGPFGRPDRVGRAEGDDGAGEGTFPASAMRYDRDGDEHYDIVSAYQKSMRGSTPTPPSTIWRAFWRRGT